MTRWARREGTATTRAGSAGVSLGWAGPGATPVWSAFGGSHDRDAKVKQFFKFILNLLHFSSLPLPRMRPLREGGPRLRPRHWSLRLPSSHHREEMSDMPGRSMGLPPIHGMQGEEGCYLNTPSFPLSLSLFQLCGCHPQGSVSRQCHPDTGLCRCLRGFEGERCDRCSGGHYNFPNCRRCNCDPRGTLEDQCTKEEEGKELCQCSPLGTCKCKVKTISPI